MTITETIEAVDLPAIHWDRISPADRALLLDFCEQVRLFCEQSLETLAGMQAELAVIRADMAAMRAATAKQARRKKAS